MEIEKIISKFTCECNYVFPSEVITTMFYEKIKKDNVQPKSTVFLAVICPKCEERVIIIRSIDKNRKLNPIPTLDKKLDKLLMDLKNDI